MGHHIHGFIAKENGVKGDPETLGKFKVCRLLQGYVFLPTEIDPDTFIAQDSICQAFLNLDDSLAKWAQEKSNIFPLVYVETEYWGGDGSQASILWKEGVIAIGPLGNINDNPQPVAEIRSNWPINTALRALGVIARNGNDEFDELGLGLHRSNESFV